MYLSISIGVKLTFVIEITSLGRPMSIQLVAAGAAGQQGGLTNNLRQRVGTRPARFVVYVSVQLLCCLPL